MQKESQAEPVLFLLHYEFKIAGLIHLLKVVWCTFDKVETLLLFFKAKLESFMSNLLSFSPALKKVTIGEETYYYSRFCALF